MTFLNQKSYAKKYFALHGCNYPIIAISKSIIIANIIYAKAGGFYSNQQKINTLDIKGIKENVRRALYAGPILRRFNTHSGDTKIGCGGSPRSFYASKETAPPGGGPMGGPWVSAA
jgi:hypothetical protein